MEVLFVCVNPCFAVEQHVATTGVHMLSSGGSVGLMGVVAHTVLDRLGEGSVLGIIPEALMPREITGDSVGELQVVQDMHTRKVRCLSLHAVHGHH